MQSLIPQPKQMTAVQESPLRLDGKARISMYMDQEDPRLAIHCRRAFPGLQYTSSRIDKGYMLVVERLSDQEPRQGDHNPESNDQAVDEVLEEREKSQLP